MKVQRLMLKENLRIASLVALLGLASCIENDIPYPLVEGTIGEIVVEGLRDGGIRRGHRPHGAYRDALRERLRRRVAAKTDAPHT